jgi:dCTP deaminase
VVLVDWQIEESVNKGEVGISNFSAECLQPASYDMRVGDEGYATAVGRVVNLDAATPLCVQPGDFAILLTHERLALPLTYMGRFGLRSCYARRGLVGTVGPQVDPGFEGKLSVGMVNFSSEEIVLEHLAPFCTLELHRMEQAARQGYTGPYQGQDSLSEETISQLGSEALPLAVMLVRQLAISVPTLRGELAQRARATSTTKPPARPTDVAFLREKRAFERLKLGLLQEHRGEYVAVYGGEVVAIGRDSTEVAQEAYGKAGYVPLYIGLVDENLPVVRIPSPRGEWPR